MIIGSNLHNIEYLFISKLIFKLCRTFIVGIVNCAICAIQNIVFVAGYRMARQLDQINESVVLSERRWKRSSMIIKVSTRDKRGACHTWFSKIPGTSTYNINFYMVLWKWVRIDASLAALIGIPSCGRFVPTNLKLSLNSRFRENLGPFTKKATIDNFNNYAL